MLTDQKHLQGPAYHNAAPKLVIITTGSASTTLALTTALEKDQVEEEIFETAQADRLVSTTPTGRQKTIQLSRQPDQRLWIRTVRMSAKADASRQEISITDSLRLSEAGQELTLIRHYDGANMPGGNADFTVLGTYKKVTAEELERETATGKGVVWTTGLSWPQILEKARQEQKGVFVDCYATWCAPCKKMDQAVFPLNWVGENMNRRFLAIKVQMDSGKNDPDAVRLAYPIARELERLYKVQALPSYLFFDDSGQLVHKAVGAFKTAEFVDILQKAAQPATQLYTRYRQALAGALPVTHHLPLAAELAKRAIGEQDKAKTVRRLYIDQQFYTLNDQELLTKEKLEQLLGLWPVVASGDRIFQLFRRDPEKINNILGKKPGETYAQDRVQDIIWQEEVMPVVNAAAVAKQTPDWATIHKTIVRKYGKNYAGGTILLRSQTWWFKQKKEWDTYSNYLYQQALAELPQRRLLDDPGNPMNPLTGLSNYLNTIAWDLFQHSNKKEQLEAALAWSKESNDLVVTQKTAPFPLPGGCDTYGNLLYKLGRKEEAITYYQKMVIDRFVTNPNSEGPLMKTLNRMKQGLPTWEDRDKWASK